MYIVTFKHGKDIGQQAMLKIDADSYVDNDGITTFKKDEVTMHQCDTTQIESIEWLWSIA